MHIIYFAGAAFAPNAAMYSAGLSGVAPSNIAPPYINHKTIAGTGRSRAKPDNFELLILSFHS